MNLNEENKLLAQKNKSLSDQLDKITNDLFKAQEIATDLKNQLDEKKHTEQLAGWAIDRALETGKFHKSEINSATQVIDAATEYCKWIKASSANPSAGNGAAN